MRSPRPPALDRITVRAIVFDLDGTLIDSYGPIRASLNHARAGFGLPPLPLATVRAAVGRGLDNLVAELVSARDVPRGVRLFRECYAEVYARDTHELPGVRETLARLHASGRRLGVASNKPARFSRAILAQLGLEPFFGAVVGPDTDGGLAPKPHPALIGRCLAELGVTASEAVYVGDMVLDVESAARAGLAVLLVRGGSSSAPELEATGERVLSCLAELTELLT